jgi:signal transduction histidine kinase
VVHDHLQQLLSLARINLGLALKPVTDRALRQALRGVDGLLSESLDITRSISSDLSPAIVHRSTLGAVVHWLGRWFGNRFGLVVEVEADEGLDVDEETRVTLFRATRELLFNVVKHARVPRAWMRLDRSGDGRPRVTVRDDGAGFDPAILRAWDGARGTFGLFSLREHLELIGGRLDVESAPGRGTTATVVGPRPRPAAAGAQVSNAAGGALPVRPTVARPASARPVRPVSRRPAKKKPR